MTVAPEREPVPSERPPDTHPDAAVWRRVARRSELTSDGPFAVSADGIDLVLVRSAAGLRSFEGHCPHQGALLGEGELDPTTGQLVCRNHRWRFDGATGKRAGGPECLRSCAVVERGDDVLVDIRPMKDAERRAPTAGRRKASSLPGPRGLPFVGNALSLKPSRLHTILEGWARRYGTPFTFRVGRERMVGIADPALADGILRARPHGFRRLATVEPIFKELGVDGVFSAEGNAWRPQRKLAMGPLSHRHQAEFYPTLRLAGERLLARLSRVAAADGEVDLHSELMRFTVDVTVKLVFGYDMNTLGEGEDVIQKKLALIFPKLNQRLFALVPWWRLFRTPSDRRLDRALADIRVWVSGLLDTARAELAADPARAESPRNFLEAMLVARDADGRPFSDDLLFGNALTMLLAGEDTTAHSVAWAIHELCDQPAAVERLRAEADDVLGAEPVPASIDVIARLHYALAVANETMRLRPIAPTLIFQANEDTAIADIEVPKGTSVMVLTRLPALSADHFADPAAFAPERWLPAAQHQGAHDARAHVPFGSGPRICPGRSLAMLEMRLMLASIYKAFDIERVGAREAVREHFSFVMTARNLRVRLRPRR